MSNTQQRRDYNFFSESINAKRSTRKKGIISAVIVFIYLILLAGVYFTFEYAVKIAQNQVDAYNEYLMSEEVSTKKQEAADKKQEINELKQFAGSLEATMKSIKDTNIIGSNYLNTITSAVPQNLHFENISMTSDQLQIQGTAPSRQLIAEYLNNMEALDLFSSIHVSNITTVTAADTTGGESYSFIMSCQLKEVIEE